MENQKNHTPGPWKLYDAGTPMVVSESGDSVASCPYSYNPEWPGTTERQAMGNARLIVAAPDLLESLRLARQHIGEVLDPSMRDGATPAVMEAIDAAITKATGQS